MIIRSDDRPFLYYREFSRALKSLPAAIMLSYAYEISKVGGAKHSVVIGGVQHYAITADEWQDKTDLTYEQQATARKKLREAGVFIEHRAGIPARIFFRINMEVVDQFFTKPENAHRHA